MTHTVEETLLALLEERGLTLGCAESCTGGLFAQRITAVPGASRVFRGGVVSYHSGVKASLLGVDPELLDREGPVCGQVAQQMAAGARRALECDLAVAFTGVAGPGPDGRGNPQGLVFAALAWEGGIRVRRLELSGDREHVRAAAAEQGMDMICRLVLGLDEPDSGK